MLDTPSPSIYTKSMSRLSPNGTWLHGRRASIKNNLSGRDLKVFELHMRGLRNKEISDILGITEQCVSNALNIEPIKEAREQVFANTVARLSSGAAVESAITIAKANAPRLMQMQIYIAENSKSDAHKLSAIRDVLDRSLGKPTQRLVVDRMDEMLEKMTDPELEAYHKDGTMPERLSYDSEAASDSIH